MMVIVSGGIDVSFTAIASLAMYVTDKVILPEDYAGSVLLAYAISAGLGLLMGALNEVLVAFLRLPTLIVTLGTASLYTGLMFGAFAASASGVPPAIADHGKQILFTAVNAGNGLTSTMPVHVLILVGVLFLVFLLLRYTMLGRGIYAIGGDEAAAERAGFNVRAIKMFLYCLVGALAGVTGIVRISMIDYADPSSMLGMELTVIAAVVLGGTRVTGGDGHADRDDPGRGADDHPRKQPDPARHPDLLEPRLHRRDHHHRHGGDGAADRLDAAARSRPSRGRKGSVSMTVTDAPVVRQARGGRDPNLVRLLVMLVFVFVLMTILRPGQFATLADFNSMMRQFPEYGIMAVGMSLTMITGGIDLGVVGTANLSAIVAATFLIGDRACGSGAGPGRPLSRRGGVARPGHRPRLRSDRRHVDLPVQHSRHPGHARHAAALYGDRHRRHQRQAAEPSAAAYSKIGNTEFLHFFPLSFVLFVAIALVVGFTLSRTRFGSYIYMIGTNAKAARYAGSTMLRSSCEPTWSRGCWRPSPGGSCGPRQLGQGRLRRALYAPVRPHRGARRRRSERRLRQGRGVTLAILILQFLSSGLNMFNSVSNFYRDVIWGGVRSLVLVFNYFFSRRADRRAIQKAS